MLSIRWVIIRACHDAYRVSSRRCSFFYQALKDETSSHLAFVYMLACFTVLQACRFAATALIWRNIYLCTQSKISHAWLLLHRIYTYSCTLFYQMFHQEEDSMFILANRQLMKCACSPDNELTLHRYEAARARLHRFFHVACNSTLSYSHSYVSQTLCICDWLVKAWTELSASPQTLSHSQSCAHDMYQSRSINVGLSPMHYLSVIAAQPGPSSTI